MTGTHDGEVQDSANSTSSMVLRELLDTDWRRLHQVAGTDAPPRRLLSAFTPRFMPVVLIRMAQRLHFRGWQRSAKVVSAANFFLFGLEVPASLEIGAGLVMPHVQGTILGAARIGHNVTIYQQVTLGAALADYGYDRATRPVIEDGATITAGAKVLGPIIIGHNSLVGANAVVLHDVPARATAVGVPARLIEPKLGASK